MITLKERFEEKYIPEPNSGCWLWEAYTDRDGYGRFGVGGEVLRAHRVSYQMYKAAPGDKHVCHRCDTPGCVNPDHLFLGTNEDNHQDKIRKKRHCYGTRNGNALLSADDVKEIRSAPKERGSGKMLAEKYGVLPSTISMIRSGKLWKEV